MTASLTSATTDCSVRGVSLGFASVTERTPWQVSVELRTSGLGVNNRV